MSEHSIDFLDTTVKIDSARKLYTTLFEKPTGTHLYLHHTSAHHRPCHTKGPFGQFLRIRRICTKNEDFISHGLEMIQHYVKRGYPLKSLKKHMLRPARHSQKDLLTVKQKEEIKTPVMVTKFNPTNPDIRGFIHNNWNIIEHSNDCVHTFSDKPIVGFRRLPNLRDILTSASITYPALEAPIKQPIAKHCTRLGRCTYCPMIHKDTTVKCNVSNKVHKLSKLPNSISCELSDIVYLITCKKCNKYYVGETGCAFRSRMYEHILSVKKPKDNRITPVSKHFTDKGHSVRDLRFSILEWCTLKYNTPNPEHRKKCERWWMWNIGAIHPIGINQFI